VAGDGLRAAAERLQAACLEAGLTVATAESCTGGLVADAITDVGGSSGYFLGGVVAYSDAAKESALGVAAAVLAEHGAVSAEVAMAMAEGARARFGADLAVGITGIAGPGGGTAAKPVGIVYVATADPGGTEVERLAWSGARLANKAASAAVALDRLLAAAVRVAGARRSADPARILAPDTPRQR
jgi:nicotinamide-nucleotide amidase